MKKKIMMGLGALTAVAAPVVGLISCGDSKTIADKLVGIYPSKLTISLADQKLDEVSKLKELTKNNQVIDTDSISIGSFIRTKINEDDKTKALMDTDEEIKTFFEDYKSKKVKLIEEWKVKNGFANNKITITIKLTTKELKPQEKITATSSKDIEITFATS